MARINKSRYAILGMLMEKPRSGYEIKQIMQRSASHFWHETDASIYPMLQTLEAKSLVVSKKEYVGKRVRKIFEITPAGADDFLVWFSLPNEVERRRDELMLKLFLGGHAPAEVVRRHLEIYLNQIVAKKSESEVIASHIKARYEEGRQKFYWNMMLTNALTHFEVEIEWVKKVIKEMEQLNANTDI